MAGTDDSALTDRLPPQDLDAEQAALGAILLGGDAVAQAVEVLAAEDFYRDAHRRVYRACLQLHDRGEPIDIVSVAAELRAADQLEAVGGFEYLDRLVRATPYSSNVLRYAAVVRDKALLRALLSCSQQIANLCYNPEITPREALDRAEASVLSLTSQQRGQGRFEHVHPVANRVFAEAEAKYYRGSALSGVSSGYPDLDRYLAGFQRGDLIVIGARPSMGKTSLAMCFALNAALAQPQPTPVAIFSLEMSCEQLVAGMICTQARVNLSRWRTGRFRNDDWQRIAEAINPLSRAPLFIDDSGALSPLEVRSRARRLKAEHQLGMVIIDYLQLMRGDTRTDNRVAEISEITRSLKSLAKELDVPVLACAQLSRVVESRQDKRPMLSDLRESGQIEADADVVMFLFREAYYQHKSDGEAEPASDELSDDHPGDPTEVIIAKQRNGPTGSVTLQFLRQFKLFVNFERDRSG